MAPARSQHPAARRWCARAAVVLGGVVAGSAAAWLLSTAGASADTAEDPVREAAQQLRDAAGKTVHDTHETVDRVTGQLRTGDEPQAGQPEPKPYPDDRDDPARNPLGSDADTAENALVTLDDLSAALGDLLGGDFQPPQPPNAEPPACAPEFQDFCERVADWFRPGSDDLVPTLPVGPGPDAGHGLPSTLPGGVHADTIDPGAVAGVAAQATEATVDVAGVSPRLDQYHESGIPGPDSPLGLPALTVPGTGSVAAGHADGAPMAITAASAASAASGALAAPHGALGAPRIPGGQPGVTPD